jgi:uncharacterized protein (TIGR03067 family)
MSILMHSMFTLMLLMTIGIAAQGTATKDLAKLSGTWVLVTAGGQAVPAGTHKALVFSGDKYQGLTNGTVDESGTIKLDPTVKPMAIDLAIATGTFAGKSQVGTVDVSGDTLTMTLGEPGATARPDASNSANKLVLTRVKPIAKEFAGDWEGALNASGQTLRIAFKLTNDADGLATGTLVSVDQGNSEGPIAAVLQNGNTLKLVIPAVRGGYEGELKDGQIAGTWTQGPNSLPLVLKRKI